MTTRPWVDDLINIDDKFGHSVHLRRRDLDLRTASSQLEALELAVDAAFVVAGERLRYCSLGIGLCSSDVYTGVPVGIGGPGRPSWLLLDHGRPGFLDIEVEWTDQQMAVVDSFEPAALKQRLRALFHAEPNVYEDELFPGWSSLHLHSTLVRLEEPIAEEPLRVSYNWGHSIYPYPLLREPSGIWVGGPCDRERIAPVHVTIQNGGWEMTLSVQLNWSYFYDERFAGAHMLRGPLAALSRLGWQRDD